MLALWVFHAPVSGPAAKQEPVRPRPSSVASAQNTSNANSLSAQDGPWMASRNHFAGIWKAGECPALPSTSALAKGAADTRLYQQLWCIPPDERVTAMLAIVPDPVHTHMSLVFDRSIEAINLATESANYVMDRYWLPWRPAALAGSAETSGQDTLTESQPGLLLFRWNGSAAEDGEHGSSGATLLYVFLVSDTSTDGINGAQFSRAVDYIRQVCAGFQPCYGKTNAIRILGPTFSGSLYSLRRLVQGRAPQPFVAYSGTVSSRCAQENQGLARSTPDCATSVAKPVANLEFQSLVTDTETAVRNFMSWLETDDHIDCKRQSDVAILSEAATAYGKASRSPGNVSSDSAKASGSSSAGLAESGTSGSSAKNPCYASFAYPREISMLRNAYGKSAASPPAPGSQNYLPLDLADLEPNKSDETPEFSRSQGPLSKEAVLMDFANEMRREHYKYIGIIGSNVLDVMFLANFLRTSCPDIRIFVLNSDLLFERDSENAPYIGTLALATYPMIGRNLRWAGAGQGLPRLPFGDGYEESQFNAALYLLKGVLPQDIAAVPYEVTASFAGPDSSTGLPSTLPLWVTVVGTSGFWPVQVLRGTETAGNAVHDSEWRLEASDYSPAWKTVTIVLSATAFLEVLVLLIATPVLSRLHDFAVAAPACSDRLFFINVASANLALCLALAAEPAWMYGWKAGYVVPLISVIAAFAIAAVLVTCYHVNQTCYRQKKISGKADLKLVGMQALYLAVWVFALVGALIWWALLASNHGYYGLFFSYRAVHLATGVSPLTPMLPLWACMYAWSIFEIIRLRFNDSARPRLSVAAGFPGSRSEYDIAHSVRRYFLDRNYVIAFFAALGVWLMAFNPRRPFQLFEEAQFGWLYEVWFVLVVMVMLSSGFRLGQIWMELRKLLRELERSPIREAFSRLKGESWSPIWQSGGEEDAWTNMSRSFDVLKQIRLCSKSLDEGLKSSIVEAENARADIRALVYPGSGQPVSGGPSALAREVPRTRKELSRSLQEKFSAIQNVLANVLHRALLVLQQEWDRRCLPGKEAHGENATSQVIVYCADQKPAQPEEKDERTVPLLEQYVALRYVAFIRAVLGHVRLLLIFLAISFSLMLISLNVYSFEPHQSLIWSFTAIFGVIAIMAIGVLMEAHRNEILSRVSGTTPNQLGWGFYARVISLGAAPLITLLATHFPSIGKFLLSFFQPGLEALK